jgi:DNA polymerase III alpha subunit
VAYALIGYWTAHLKANHKKEFYAASLTHNEWQEKSYDPNKKKNTLLKEIKKKGYDVIPPKRKYSDTINWTFHNKNLYVPFLELNGVGETSVNKCLKSVKKTKMQGFFGSDF